MDTGRGPGSAPEELDPACGLFQQGFDLGQLRNKGRGLLHPFSVELDQGVPAFNDLSGLEVADPVVGQS